MSCCNRSTIVKNVFVRLFVCAFIFLSVLAKADTNSVPIANPGFPPSGYKDYLYIQVGHEAPFLHSATNNIKQIARSSASMIIVYDDGTIGGFGYDPLVYEPYSTPSETPVVKWFDLPAYSNVVSVACDWSNYFLFQMADGSVAGWGNTNHSYGVENIPQNLTNATSVAAGAGFATAVTDAGEIVIWGDDLTGFTNVVDNVNNASNVLAGYDFAIALLTNRNIIAWGDNTYNQTNVPENVTNVLDVAVGSSHAVAVLNDGEVVAWGFNGSGQTNVPANVYNAMAVAAGWDHSLALIQDGAVVSWGGGTNGQVSVPWYVTNAWDIGATEVQSHALLSDGSASVWGGESTLPPPDIPLSFIGSDFTCRVLQAAYSSACDPQLLVAVIRAPLDSFESDSDEDDLSMFDELYVYDTDPEVVDSDGDGVSDGAEVLVYGSNPNSTDSDSDYLSDGTETEVPCLTLWNASDSQEALFLDYRVQQVAASETVRAALLENGTVMIFTGEGSTLQVYSNCCNAVDLDATKSWIIAALSDGKVYVWSASGGSVPTDTFNFTDAVDVAGGYEHFLVRHSGGGVTCIKEDFSGDPEIDTSSFCEDISTAVKISAGDDSDAILLSNGNVISGDASSTYDYEISPPSGSTVVDIAAGKDKYYCVLFSNGEAKAYYKTTVKATSTANGTRIAADRDTLFLVVRTDGSHGYYTKGGSSWSYSTSYFYEDAENIWWRWGTGLLTTDEGELKVIQNAPVSTNALDYMEAAVTPGSLSRAIAMACSGTMVTNADSDADGFLDGWEVKYGFNPRVSLSPDPSADPDGDGLTNLQEHEVNSNPYVEDTDGDGYNDKWEYDNDFDPTDPLDTISDPDQDGLINADEHIFGTRPDKADTDGDGLSDKIETTQIFPTLWCSTNVLGTILLDADAIQVTASDTARAALLSDGKVLIFTGDGANLQTYTNDVDAVAIDATEKWIIARLSTGAVKVWRELSGGGLGTSTFNYTDVVQISGGYGHFLTRHSSGDVKRIQDDGTGLPEVDTGTYLGMINDALDISAGCESDAVIIDGNIVKHGDSASLIGASETFTSTPVGIAAGSDEYIIVMLQNSNAYVVLNGTIKGSATGNNVAKIAAGGDSQLLVVSTNGVNGIYNVSNDSWDNSYETNDLLNTKSIWWRRGCRIAVASDGDLISMLNITNQYRALEYLDVAATPAGLARGIALACTATCPTNSDCDADGLDDGWEIKYGLDPNDPSDIDKDTDGDTMPDLWEINNNFNRFDASDAYLDSDNDGLTNWAECVSGTYPHIEDSDNDGLSDGEEVNVYETNPKDYDSDGDSLSDGAEENVHGTDPNDPDTDNDGYSDGLEIINGTDPLVDIMDNVFMYHTYDEGEGTNSVDISENTNHIYFLNTNHVNWVEDCLYGSVVRIDGDASDVGPGLEGAYVVIYGTTNINLSEEMTINMKLKPDAQLSTEPVPILSIVDVFNPSKEYVGVNGCTTNDGFNFSGIVDNGSEVQSADDFATVEEGEWVDLSVTVGLTNTVIVAGEKKADMPVGFNTFSEKVVLVVGTGSNSTEGAFCGDIALTAGAKGSGSMDVVTVLTGLGDTDGDGMDDVWEEKYKFNKLSGLQDSLIGWWQFREGSSSQSDNLSPYVTGNNALINNSSEYTGWSDDAPIGKAFLVDAGGESVGSFVSVPDLATWEPSEGYTIALWVLSQNSATFKPVVTKTSNLGIYSDPAYYSVVQVNCDNSVCEVTTSPYGSNQGEWVHICCTHDGATSKIYYNGVLMDSTMHDSPLFDGVGSVKFGYWGEKIADVRIYSAALSEEDINELLVFNQDIDNNGEGDGLTNFEESENECSPYLSDTDGDGISDYDEVKVYGTDPSDPKGDADGDGMEDWWEISYFLDPNDPSDCFLDGDNDWLANIEEFMYCQTDPNEWDSDGDGLSDVWETQHFNDGYDPNSAEIDNDNGDGTGDGFPDAWEIKWFGSLTEIGVDDIHEDFDDDGFDNWNELSVYTDPAFAIDFVANSRGRIKFDWTEVNGATSYELSLFKGGSLIRSITTSATSVIVTGNYEYAKCTVYDPRILRNRIASMVINGICLRHESTLISFLSSGDDNSCCLYYIPAGKPQIGEVFFERTVNVEQNNLWPEYYCLQYLYELYPFPALNIYDQDDQFIASVNCCGPNDTEPKFLPTGTGLESFTICHTVEEEAIRYGVGYGSGIVMGPCEIWCWRPEIEISNVADIETADDSISVVVMSDGNDTYQADFQINYDGFPFPEMVDRERYGSMSFAELENDGVTLYAPLNASGYIEGGSFSIDLSSPDISVSDISVPLSVAEDSLASRKLCAVEMKFSPIIESGYFFENSKNDFYPLDSSSLRSSFVNGGTKYDSDALYSAKEVGFNVLLTGDPSIVDNLTVSPPSPIMWPQLSDEKYVQPEPVTGGLMVLSLEGDPDPGECQGNTTNVTVSGNSSGGTSSTGNSQPCCGDCGESEPEPDPDPDPEKERKKYKCDCGRDGGESGSVRFRLSLGYSDYDTLNGMVWFNVEENSQVVSMDLFEIMKTDAVTVEDYDYGYLQYRTITAPGGRYIAIWTYGDGEFIIANYLNSEIENTWIIANGQDDQEIRVRKFSGLSETDSPIGLLEDNLFVNINNQWVNKDLMAGGATETKIHEGDLDEDGYEITKHLIFSDSDMIDRLSGYLETNKYITCGMNKVIRCVASATWDGVSQSWRTTTTSYWEDSSRDLHGKPKLEYSEYNGYWRYRVYDTQGRVTLRAEVFNGSQPPSDSPDSPKDLFELAEEVTDAKVTVYDYADAELGDILDVKKARFVSEYVIQSSESPILTSLKWHDYTRSLSEDGYAILTHRLTEAATATEELEKSDENNKWIESVSFVDDLESSSTLAPTYLRGRTISTTYYEGNTQSTVKKFTSNIYQIGSYNSANGSFAEQEGGSFIRVVSRNGTTPNGTISSAYGIKNKSTYIVEILETFRANTVRGEERLYVTGDPDADPVLTYYDTTNRVSDGKELKTVYSDGTFTSNEWSCCELIGTFQRDGSYISYVDNPNIEYSDSVNETIALLPGADGNVGSCPLKRTYSDALGRATNTVRMVVEAVSLEQDQDYVEQISRTEYPFGTSDYSEQFDPHGNKRTSFSFYNENGNYVRETVSNGVTNRTIQVTGGPSVNEKEWFDTVSGEHMWTVLSNITTWVESGDDVYRVETVIKNASDMIDGPVVESETTYDILGRVYISSNVLSVSTNFYVDGRLERTRRRGNPDTYYLYDALGNVIETALDVDNDKDFSYVGTDPDDNIDRISGIDTYYEERDNDWWRVTVHYTYLENDSSDTTTSSVDRIQISGLGDAASQFDVPVSITASAILTACSLSEDANGVVITNYTFIDPSPDKVEKWLVTASPYSSECSIQKSIAGYPVECISASQLETSYLYDGFGRQVSTTDGRNNTSTIVYNDYGQVKYTQDSALNKTWYAYDQLGRRVGTTNALDEVSHSFFDNVGLIRATWGTSYPVAYQYDTSGRKIAMATTTNNIYRTSNLLTQLGSGENLNDSDLDVEELAITKWMYNETTGLLTNKVYADGNGPSYTYTDTGKLRTRKWARDVTTTYWYDNLGQMTNVVYYDDNNTPSVAYTYDRIGRQKIITIGNYVVSNAYSGLNLDKEFQDGVEVSHSYDGLGRVNGYSLTPDGLNLSTADVTYGFDDCGRLKTVDATQLTAGQSFIYSYLDDSDMFSGYTADVTGSGISLSVKRTYEQDRDLITTVTNEWNNSVRSAFEYGKDVLGRRQSRLDTYLNSSRNNYFSHNEFSEIVYDEAYGIHMYQDNYTYDPVGNRTSTQFWSADDSVTRNIYYESNDLNQYTSLSGDMAASPIYDSDGNMVLCGAWTNVWDAENRLILTSNTATDVTVMYSYDHQSRRVSSVVSNGQTEVRRNNFVYDGWNLIFETIETPSVLTTNYYTWGADLSGALQGAGGVGGLLSVTENAAGAVNSYYPVCDANGNITEYLDGTGGIVAHYEYDAFGNPRADSGTMINDFRFRFSSKYLDEETDKYYYGYRYYNSELGRFLSRDPVEESDGPGVYLFLENNPVNTFDVLGLMKSVVNIEYTGLKDGKTKVIGNKGSTYTDIKPEFDTNKNWGYQDYSRPEVFIVFDDYDEGCATITVKIRVHLNPSLKEKLHMPEKNDHYALRPHIVKDKEGNVIKRGDAAGDVYRNGMSVGNIVMYKYALAHEQGHAKHYFAKIADLKKRIKTSAKEWNKETTSERAEAKVVGIMNKFFNENAELSRENADAAELSEISKNPKWHSLNMKHMDNYSKKGFTKVWMWY